MKNNILIIAIVTLVAVGVIVAVILTSVLNNAGPPDNSGDSSGYSSEFPSESESPSTSDKPSDSSDEHSSTDNSDPPSDPSSADSSDNSSNNEAERIVAAANSLIGVPFAENGSDPDGFDNSGFIYYVLRENGYITCPRGTEEQSRMGTRLNYDELKDGDLVFFSDEGSDEVSFGGIYAGNGKMIACLMPGTLVREVDITTDYYRENFFGGVSLT